MSFLFLGDMEVYGASVHARVYYGGASGPFVVISLLFFKY
jgi:hypothetical protein